MIASLRRLSLLACALLATPLSFATDTPTPREMWHGAVELQYAELSAASERLEASAARFCQSPDEALRQRLENDWLSAYQAWQAVRFIQFGPVEQNSRGWPKPQMPKISPVTAWRSKAFPLLNTCFMTTPWMNRP